MTETMGLRERKKMRTRTAISEAAVTLFMERGFDNVSVTEVAAAADVSKMTVFNYFPTKEDLVFHRMIDHTEESATVVRLRKPGQTPTSALREHFRQALVDHNPITGLNASVEYRTFQKMVLETPSLRLRVMEQNKHNQDALVEAFREVLGSGDDASAATALVAASQVIAVQQSLVFDNVARMLAGESVADVCPIAVAAAERAFDILENGLTGVGL